MRSSLLSAAALAVAIAAPLPLSAAQDPVVSHSISISTREATLELELASGRVRSLSLRGGQVFVDSRQAADYTPGGQLDRDWRRLLNDGGSLDTRALLATLRSWRAPTLSAGERAAKTQLESALAGLSAAAPVLASHPAEVPAEQPATRVAPLPAGASIKLGDVSTLDTVARELSAIDEDDLADVLRSGSVRLGSVDVASGQKIDGDLLVFRGDATVSGEVTGNVVAVFGSVLVNRGGHVGKDAVAVAGSVVDSLGTVDGDSRIISRDDLAGADLPEVVPAAPGRALHARSAVDRVFADVVLVVGWFLACAMLGFGAVFFGRHQLEIVADTARQSFGRSFLTGLLGQLMLVPTFAALIVGLTLTVVGILLVPIAIFAYLVAAAAALTGGYLAVAHAVGETYTRRRMAHGAFVSAPNAYGYLFTGLIGLLGLWAAAALTGWMGPVVVIFRVLAVMVTWFAVTTGFGAVLLSRAGLRQTFAGGRMGEATDEYLWATPPATPTAARMKDQP